MKFYSSTVSKLSSEDLHQLHHLDQTFFPQPWKMEDWKQCGPDDYVAYFKQDEIVGFALFHHSQLEQLIHLLKVVIKPEVRGQGLGKNLLENSFKMFKTLEVTRCYLEVETENTVAQGLYKRMGFQSLNRISKFYSNGSDAFIFELHF